MFGVALTRTYSLVKMLPNVDIWVMDQNTKAFSNTFNLERLDLLKIKGISGVQEVSPLYSNSAPITTLLKKQLETTIIGVDPKVSFGLPVSFIQGKAQNISYEGGSFIDSLTSKKQKLRIGSKIKTSGTSSTIVGVFSYPKTFGQSPLLISSIDHAKKLTKESSGGFPFILVKKLPGANGSILKSQIEKATHLRAFDKSEFISLILAKSMQDAGLPSAFSAVVICGVTLAMGIILATLFSLSENSKRELTIYKSVGASNISISFILAFYSITTISIALAAALSYHFFLITFMPSGTFVFAPNMQIVLYILGGAYLTGVIVSLLSGSSIKTVGAKQV